MAHALLSASSADRWLNCHQSVRLTEHIGSSTSPSAQAGTVAHALAELKLNNWFKGAELSLDSIKESAYYDKEMEDYTDEYVNYIIEQQAEMGDATWVEFEKRVDFDKWVPSGFGTCDTVLCNNEVLHIIDLKYGVGVPVKAYENPQLKLYALGAYDNLSFLYGFEKIKVTIAMVRLEYFDTYELTVDELLDWANHTVKPAAELAYKGKGDICAGSWCRWCKIRKTCRTRANWLLKGTEQSLEELTRDEISELLQKTKELTNWCKDLEEWAVEEIMEGREVPGWKIVEGRAKRKIEDEEGLVKEIRALGFQDEQIYKPRTLNTMGDLQKLVTKQKFEEISIPYIVQPRGKPTLASVHDKRKDYRKAEVEDEFDFN